MPNWCHNTLTVSGEEVDIARFVAAVRESDEQPLSFAKLVPEPSEEEFAAIDDANKIECYMCGGNGDLPESSEQAEERGAKWFTWMQPAERPDRTCNVCSGEGRALPSITDSAWREWRAQNWGCKWDASFGGGRIALVQDEADLDVSVETQGVVITKNVAIYKFDTPWAPPAPFVEHASEQFPNLEFVLQYAEVGEGYAGVEKYVAGLCVEREELEVTDVLAPEEMWF